VALFPIINSSATEHRPPIELKNGLTGSGVRMEHPACQVGSIPVTVMFNRVGAVSNTYGTGWIFEAERIG
jgi:hypothetical protein